MKLFLSFSKEALLENSRAFKALVQRVDPKRFTEQLNNLLSEMADFSSPKWLRITGAKIGGVLCAMGFPLSGVVFDKIRLLCQDQDKEVRVYMISHVMAKLFKGIDNELCQTVLAQKVSIFLKRDFLW